MSCLINIQSLNSRNGAPYTVHHVKVTGSISSSNKKLIRPATKTADSTNIHTYIHTNGSNHHRHVTSASAKHSKFSLAPASRTTTDKATPTPPHNANYRQSFTD